ncbi:MAG: DUF4440 domain-containing protein [Aridibacter famidurans]|nr:DUF4440 domain-containing protein [Aridibacter famidurans]
MFLIRSGGGAAAAFLLMLSTGLLAQSGEEIIKRERYFYDQLKAKNLEALPAIFEENFNGVFSGGILTKADEVKGFRQAVLDDYRFSNIVVRFPSRDVAIIIYRAYIKGSYEGKDVTGDSYHTSTYIKKDGAWLMTLHTEAAVPAASGSEKKMSEEFRGIATAAYFVPDVEKAKAWYAKAFGTEPYFDEPFYVGFNINGYELGIQPAEGTRVAGNSQIAYWAVPDCGAAYKRFIENGASKHEEPNDVGGGVVVASVKDPWDNIIGLIYNPVFKK